MKIIKRILGSFGYRYCHVCGSDLILNEDLVDKWLLGYSVSSVYECPNNHYLTPCTKEAKENMEQVNSLKGKL